MITTTTTGMAFKYSDRLITVLREELVRLQEEQDSIRAFLREQGESYTVNATPSSNNETWTFTYQEPKEAVKKLDLSLQPKNETHPTTRSLLNNEIIRIIYCSDRKQTTADDILKEFGDSVVENLGKNAKQRIHIQLADLCRSGHLKRVSRGVYKLNKPKQKSRQ